MNALECGREPEIAEAILFGRWSAERHPELAAHAASCPVCRDVVDVARALHEERETAIRDARPPTAGVVWWRATIRARADAAHIAMQPITVLQGIAGACIAGATAALAMGAWRGLDATGRLADLVSRFAMERGMAASGFAFEHALIALAGFAACLVLAPLALFLTLTDE